MKKKLYQKGLEHELQSSKIIHKKGIPLLISDIVLREIGAGQIDLALIKKTEIQIFEVKHKDSYGLSYLQYNRLRNSADFLSKILDKKISFEVIT